MVGNQIHHIRLRPLSPADVGWRATLLTDLDDPDALTGEPVTIVRSIPPDNDGEPRWIVERRVFRDLYLDTEPMDIRQFVAAESDLCLVEWLLPTDRPLTADDTHGLAILLVDQNDQDLHLQAGDRVTLLDFAGVDSAGKPGWWIERAGDSDITAAPEDFLQLILSHGKANHLDTSVGSPV